MLGPAYRLFYEQPIHIIRGSGCHLFDDQGRDYLDAYNNVASVGHAHPRVTEAVSAQAAQLNTHTRYLHDGIVNYSEDLLATFPAQLGHVMYTCTGSEAGDLALRIAKHHTGGEGVIVTRNAYHGVTTEVASISPSLAGAQSLAGWARWVPAPDPLRCDLTEFDSLGHWFAAEVQTAIDDLESHGITFAAFIADSIFASDGILPEPRGFLAPVAEVVHAAGGLYIADEVQSGFGRTGDAMWGFQRHHSSGSPLVPDLVTVGKPMGNGMPVAATIMQPQLMATFGRDVRYFNTFGGNAVSIAAAQAVLDIIREENLQQNAKVVGSSLRRMLQELATQHQVVGDVRGAGLFLGVEIVRPGTTSEPDEECRCPGRQCPPPSPRSARNGWPEQQRAEGSPPSGLLAGRRRSTRHRAGCGAGGGVPVKPPTRADVVAAAAVVRPRIRHTPTMSAAVTTSGREVPVTFKLECLQVTGSFKPRGALNALMALDAAEVIACSGGNHGLAVAWSAKVLGRHATVVVPESAARTKVHAMRDAGAEVVEHGDTPAEAFAYADTLVRERGWPLVHPYDQPPTVAGQGTLGLELLTDAPDVTHWLTAVGGGGLAAGVVLALDEAAEVVPIEPEGCPSLAEAQAAGGPVPTIAEGVARTSLGAPTLGNLPWQVLRTTVPRCTLVSDLEIEQARRWLWSN